MFCNMRLAKGERESHGRDPVAPLEFQKSSGGNVRAMSLGGTSTPCHALRAVQGRPYSPKAFLIWGTWAKVEISAQYAMTPTPTTTAKPMSKVKRAGRL
jgi:hypothetical protein